MSSRIYPVAAALALLATSLVGLPAEAAAQQSDPVPSGAPASGQEAIEVLGTGLPRAAGDAGLSPAELIDRLTTDPSLQATPDGVLTYDDPAPTAPPQARAGDTDAAAFVPGSTFNLSSKPGSDRTIYLDFRGGTVTDTYWNASYTSGAPIVVPPWDADGNSATLSIAEQKIIQTTWHVVAEDFAPWDVNVTTADPGRAAIDRANTADQKFGQRVMFSNSNHGLCSGCGGVAVVGAFDAVGTYAGPVWAFTDALFGDPKYFGDVASHELGHTFTLAHDGTSQTNYYAGHGDWSPIMGSAAWRPIVQWSKGEYGDANQQQDDLALIAANGVNLNPDDHGNTIATGTRITPAAPVEGLIATSSDVDHFAFDGSGPFTASLSTWAEHPNLDARLRLLNSSGTQVAVSDPQKLATPSLSVPALPNGRYSIAVDGVGWGDPLGLGYTDYGSLGTYTLTADFNQAPTANGTISPTTVPYQGTLSYNASLSNDPDGTITAYNWNFGDGTTSTSVSGTKAYSAPGSYTVTLKVTDNKGATGTKTFVVNAKQPEAVDDTASTSEHGVVSIFVLDNDIPFPAPAASIVAVTQPAKGSASIFSLPSKGIRFDPGNDFDGLGTGETEDATFTYTRKLDGYTDTATVTVTVSGENDAPVASDGFKTTDEDTVLTFAAPMSDVDGEPLTITNTTQPSAGSVTISGTNLVFKPGNDFQALAAGQTRQVTFTYTASDGDLTDTGTITITVTGVNDAPVAVADNYSAVAGRSLTFDPVTGPGADSDVDTPVSQLTVPALPHGGSGTISRVSDTKFTYYPPPAADLLRIGTSMTDTFTYTVSDGDLTDTATITFTVSRELPAECALAPPHGFTDVASGDWFDSPVAWVKALGITNGTTPTLYEPHVRTTRGQMATFLWRLRGEPTGNADPGFSDVASEAYYSEAVAYLVGTGVTSGTSATKFSPNAPVTRAQMVTFLWRLAGRPATAASNPFNDVRAGDFYTVAAIWAAEVGITIGVSPGTFSPNSAVTRAQMATFLRHYVCTVGYA